MGPMGSRGMGPNKNKQITRRTKTYQENHKMYQAYQDVPGKTNNNSTSVVSPVDTTYIFLRFWTSDKYTCLLLRAKGVVLLIFAIWANVDLNSRLNTCKLAI